MTAVKAYHAAAVALVLLASCAPHKAAIDAATQRAEAAAKRAEKSAEIAGRAASQSVDASVRALKFAEAAEHSRQRAADSVSRMAYDPVPAVYGIQDATSPSTKPHHAVALLVGWYLMVPYMKGGAPDSAAPLSQWKINSRCDTAKECEDAAEKLRDKLLTGGQLNEKALELSQTITCVATNDPRLKEK